MPTSNNYPPNCPTTLEKSLETLQSTWNVEAARELPDWDVNETMEAILASTDEDKRDTVDPCQVEGAASSRPHRRMRRRRALTAFRCRIGTMIDSLRLNSAVFIVMMSAISVAAMWSNPLLGAACLGLAMLVASRVIYADLRQHFTWWRLRRTIPSLFKKSANTEDRAVDTPLFEEVGRYATPKVLEELRKNLEILREQHHWRVVHLDRRVFKDHFVPAADKEVIAAAEVREVGDTGDNTQSSCSGSTQGLENVGKHRQAQQFPYLLQDEEREAS